MTQTTRIFFCLLQEKSWTYIPSENDRLTLNIEFKFDVK